MLTEEEIIDYKDLKENSINGWDAKRMYELEQKMDKKQWRDLHGCAECV